ncbi:probable glutathione S-transferase [Abrus precatorius]|uniref:Glutathione S-transferase n=1 Tax=Abrus precatorius TaxID=3816 RepID=A0A8B8MAT7_ABRPR|nr:probable glutathione S-transferase [Abrus precatorius]XP_027365670.1 probable glutathione S-transferase [Abrus precatorius]
MAEVKLHGFWYSPFTMRVVWALKLKGISYENIEEDRFNKSPQLLQHNPVHKKTPVLVHGGKPICESMIIVEYIDEIWPHNPLLPVDPYERALARFWVRYAEDMVSSTLAPFFRSNNGEERKKVIEKIWQYFRVVEDQCLDHQEKYLGGNTINVVDIAFGSAVKFILALEAMFEVEVLEAQKFPRLHSWFYNFKNVPLIAENLPDQEKLVTFLKPLREKMLASS